MPAGLVGDDHAHDTLEDAARRELIEETGWQPANVEVLLIGPTSAGMSNERIAFVRAARPDPVGDGGGVDSEDITVHAVPRAEAPAWLMQKRAEGFELDLKLWAGLWMIDRNPDGSPACRPDAPADSRLRSRRSDRSPRTSASMFSASNAECPDVGEITSSAFGQALCSSQAFAIGQTTS